MGAAAGLKALQVIRGAGSPADRQAFSGAVDAATPGRFRNGKLDLRASRLRLPNGLLGRRVMTSPPTVTVASASQFTGARFLPATIAQDVGNGTQFNTKLAANDFALAGAGNFKVTGTGADSSRTIHPENVSYNDSVNTMNFWRAAVQHAGSKIEFVVRGVSQDAAAGTKLLFKVNDEYVSLVPTQVGTAGLQYITLDFGSPASRRIEIIGKMRFGGAYVGQNDTAYPAPIRGPRTIILGDSWTASTGATSPGTGPAYPLGWVQCFADIMGWDDVWPSGIGGTGYLNVSGGPRTYRTRLATDVVPYNPELLLITGGTNDFAFNYAQIYAEAVLLFNAAKDALPTTTIVAVSPFSDKGAGGARWVQYDAIKQAAADTGVYFADTQAMPLPRNAPSDTLTVFQNVGSGSVINFTELPVLGATYSQVGTPKRFLIRSIAGTSSPWQATVDNTISVFLNAGTQFVRVGNGYVTGVGRVGAETGFGNADVLMDSTAHPTNLGHEATAQAVATALLTALGPSA